MSQTNIWRAIIAAMAIGLAAIGAYLNTHGQDAFFLWLGVVICFYEVI